jgi:hypothetical protein
MGGFIKASQTRKHWSENEKGKIVISLIFLEGWEFGRDRLTPVFKEPVEDFVDS